MSNDALCVPGRRDGSGRPALIELAKGDLGSVAGGLNPQPLPPFVDPDSLAFKPTPQPW